MCSRYLVPDRARLDESLRFAEKYDSAFEYDDFYLPDVMDDREEMKRRIRRYREIARDRSRDTLHGAFYDVNVASDDARIRKIADCRIRQSMEAARELGVKAVIFHTNNIPGFRLKAYRENWVNRNVEYYEKLLSDYPDRDIYVENMFDMEPDLLVSLAAGLSHRRNFGVCLDYAHAAISGRPPEEWIKRTAPYIRHIHINDNNGSEDQHLAVGDGKTDWREYDELIRRYRLDGGNIGVLIEVGGLEKLERSIEYLRERRYFPFS